MHSAPACSQRRWRKQQAWCSNTRTWAAAERRLQRLQFNVLLSDIRLRLAGAVCLVGQDVVEGLLRPTCRQEQREQREAPRAVDTRSHRQAGRQAGKGGATEGSGNGDSTPSRAPVQLLWPTCQLADTHLLPPVLAGLAGVVPAHNDAPAGKHAVKQFGKQCGASVREATWGSI